MNAQFKKLRELISRYRNVTFLLPWVCFGIGYPLLDRGYRYFFHQAFPWYTGWQAFKTRSPIYTTASNWAWLLAALLVMVPLVLRWKKLSWSTMELKHVRWVVTVLAMIYAWDLSFSGYNFLYDEGFVFERFAMLLLGVLVYRHPFFLAPLLIVGFGFSSQFELTFSESLLPEVFLFERLLLVVVVFLYLRALVSVSDKFLLFGFLCVPFGFLWQEAIVKMTAGEQWFDWAIYYSPEFAGGWARTQGWPGFLPRDLVSFLVGFLGKVGWVLPHLGQWFALFAPLAFLGFSAVLFYLGGFLLILLLVFLVAGVLLWQEMVATGLLAGLVVWNRGSFFRFLSGKHLAVSVVLLILFPVIGFLPTFDLTWWETRYVSRIDLRMISETGESFQLHPDDFRPYRNRLGVSAYQLRGIIPFPYLPSSSTDPTRARKLNSMLDNEEMALALNRAKMELGKNENNKWDTRQFRQFLKKYLSNLKNRTKTQVFLDGFFGLLGPPDTFYVPFSTRKTKGQPIHDVKRIRDVNVLFTEGIIREGKVHLINPPEGINYPDKTKLGLKIHRDRKDE